MRKFRNPRVNVSLRPEQYELVTRLARYQNRSRADVLRELLETVTPVLERVAVVTEAAFQARRQATEGLRESMEAAEAAIAPHVEAAMTQFDAFAENVFRSATGGFALAAGGERSDPPAASPTPVAVTTGVRSGERTGPPQTKKRVSRSPRRKK